MKQHTLTQTEQKFKDLFIGAHRDKYALQKKGSEWVTIHKYSTDWHIKAHLEERESLGMNARWRTLTCSNLLCSCEALSCLLFEAFGWLPRSSATETERRRPVR